MHNKLEKLLNKTYILQGKKLETCHGRGGSFLGDLRKGRELITDKMCIVPHTIAYQSLGTLKTKYDFIILFSDTHMHTVKLIMLIQFMNIIINDPCSLSLVFLIYLFPFIAILHIYSYLTNSHTNMFTVYLECGCFGKSEPFCVGGGR